jgi:hypothetical protein
VIVNAVDIMLFGSWPQAIVSDIFGLCEHATRPIKRFHQIFTKVNLTLWTIDDWASKLYIYIEYMVAFGNHDWMYYIKKLNNDKYPPNMKRLSVKYDFKCAK